MLLVLFIQIFLHTHILRSRNLNLFIFIYIIFHLHYNIIITKFLSIILFDSVYLISRFILICLPLEYILVYVHVGNATTHFRHIYLTTLTVCRSDSLQYVSAYTLSVILFFPIHVESQQLVLRYIIII